MGGMLEAKLISAKSLNDLEATLCAFLKGKEAAQIKCVSGVTVARHPTVGGDTYVVVVTHEK
jgi:hypothetical protein